MTSSLLIVEQALFGDLDESDLRLATCYAALTRVREHAAQSVLVDESGTPLTPPLFRDDWVSLSASGRAARLRRLTQEAVGGPPGADYVAIHSPWLYADKIEPWTDIAITYRPQPFLGRDAAGTDAVPAASFFIPGPLALSPDGRLLAVVEFRGQAASGVSPYRLVVDDVTSGERRASITLDGGHAPGFLSFAPGGQWLLVGPTATAAPATLVSWADGVHLTLPAWLDEAAWDVAAGSDVLMATREDDDGVISVGRFALGSTTWTPLGPLPPPLDDGLFLTRLAVSPDGTRLAGLAPLPPGEPLLAVHGGGGMHAFIVDLGSGTGEYVLPFGFTSSVLRTHEQVLWSQPPPVGPTFAPASALVATATRISPAADLDAGQLERQVRRYAKSVFDLITAAAQRRIEPPLVLGEVRSLVFAATDLAPEVAEGALALVSNIASRFRTGDDKRSLWNALAVDLQAMLHRTAPSPYLAPSSQPPPPPTHPQPQPPTESPQRPPSSDGGLDSRRYANIARELRAARALAERDDGSADESADDIHQRLTGGQQQLHTDPNAMIADGVIALALERREVVTANMIMEVFMVSLLAMGTTWFEAARGMKLHLACRTVISTLDAAGRSDLYDASIPQQAAKVPPPPLGPGDRVELTGDWEYDGRRYPQGSQGVITEHDDPQTRAELAKRGLLLVWLDVQCVLVAPDVMLRGIDPRQTNAKKRHKTKDKGNDKTKDEGKTKAPRWFGFGEEVELDCDITIDGRPYTRGTRGVIPHWVKDSTLAELAADSRQVVEFPGNDIRVIPSSLLRPARDPSAHTRTSARADPRNCSHQWEHVGYKWAPVDPDRGERPFWCRYECRSCGAEKLDDADEYCADDMHIVHLKWCGSAW